MLDNIKLLLGLTGDEKNDLITLLISLTEDEVKAYCNITEFHEGLTNAAIQIVVIKYNRIGTEGLVSQNFNGASESFTDIYPASIIKALNRYRRVKLL